MRIKNLALASITSLIALIPFSAYASYQDREKCASKGMSYLATPDPSILLCTYDNMVFALGYPDEEINGEVVSSVAAMQGPTQADINLVMATRESIDAGLEYRATYNFLNESFYPNPHQPETYQEFLNIQASNEGVRNCVFWAKAYFQALYHPQTGSYGGGD